MSGIFNSSLSSSNSSLVDARGRAFASPFPSQSANAPTFYHAGNMQGLQPGSLVSNIQGSLNSRNPAMPSISSSIPQLGGNIYSGRFPSNNLPVAMSQIPYGHAGIADRGGINVVGNPGFSSSISGVGGSVHGSGFTSADNRNNVLGMGLNPILGNYGPRISSSVGSVAAGGNVGRVSRSGEINISGLSSRANLAVNSGSGALHLQGTNRVMGGMLQQAPQMMGMLRNSYTTSGGTISQSQLQAGNNLLRSMGMLSNINSNDGSPFDINDFPQLTGRPNSAGGPQGSLRKQGLGMSSIVQQNQEFSIQNEDFPALPGYKGGNMDFPTGLHQKEFSREDLSVMQSQNFSTLRSSDPTHRGTYPSSHQQQQHSTPGQNSGPSSTGLWPLDSQLSTGSYDQLQPYQHPHNHPLNSQWSTDKFCLLGLLSLLRGNNPSLTSLALGMDLTTLGLDLQSSQGDLHKMFSSPWTNEPYEGEPEFGIPSCYCSKPPPVLKQGHLGKFLTGTLFYIFFSMPRDEAQVLAACELYSRGWLYHRDLQFWLKRIEEPLVKTQTYERGSYSFFDPNTWQLICKENFVLSYEALENKPILPPC